MALLVNSDEHKYGHTIAELHDNYLKKNKYYPTDMAAMYKLLNEHSNDKKTIDPNAVRAPHLAFAQTIAGG